MACRPSGDEVPPRLTLDVGKRPRAVKNGPLPGLQPTRDQRLHSLSHASRAFDPDADRHVFGAAALTRTREACQAPRMGSFRGLPRNAIAPIRNRLHTVGGEHGFNEFQIAHLLSDSQ